MTQPSDRLDRLDRELRSDFARSRPEFGIWLHERVDELERRLDALDPLDPPSSLLARLRLHFRRRAHWYAAGYIAGQAACKCSGIL